MSLLNLNLNLVSYADDGKTANPQIKFTDLAWSMQGLPTGTPRMVPIAMAPGETRTIMSVTQPISFTGSTSFQFVQIPNSSNVQLLCSIGQRTARLSGDGTTQWAITVNGQIATLTYTGTGTAPTFSGMVAGDGLALAAPPFAIQNQGNFTILRVGSNFVTFQNPFALAETVTGQVDIFSNGPVQVGDLIELTDPVFSYPNQGQFMITAVTDKYVRFSNPSALAETVTGASAGGVVVYREAHQWMLLAVDQKVIVQCNGDTGLGVVVEPPSAGDLVKYPGLMLKRGKLYSLALYNPGLNVANGFVFLAE